MKQILKAIYALIPFKKDFYSALKIFWTPNESIYKHLHFKESFTVRIDKNRKFKIHNGNQIENEIFWEGLTCKWEKESIKLWLHLCEFSNCIFDIGANTGVYALVAKTTNPKAEVYAFEPHPLFYNMLQRNVEINSYDIKSYKKAVSNFDGNLSIEDYSGSSPSITVESIALDTFITQNKLEKIDLLKIDVETHEPQVLEGFLKHLSEFKPTFLIEILNNEIAEIIFNTVSKYEYLYFNIDERQGVRQTDRIEKSDYFNYLLCSRETANKLGLLKNRL
jgi:FkbM family methyltransferase